MFKNPGKAIKTIANVLLWIALAVVVIAFIVETIALNSNGGRFGAFESILIIVGFLLIAVLVIALSAMIYGYGTNVENIQAIRDTIAQTQEKTGK